MSMFLHIQLHWDYGKIPGLNGNKESHFILTGIPGEPCGPTGPCNPRGPGSPFPLNKK